MKRVILYTRVSTEDQAKNGYSLTEQAEVLNYHALIKGMEVVQIITEDHSAKNFNRPAWKELEKSLRLMKGQVDEILVTKWDRFSRSTPEAHRMFTKLAAWGVTVVAIEQPLDLSIPENLLILNNYLTMAEVWNKRHAITVRDCMRRATMQGRYMGKAPHGYKNHRGKDNKAYILKEEPCAGIVKDVFNVLVASKLTVTELRAYAKQKGLKTSKNAFLEMLRNPFYMGKVYVRPTDRERGYLAIGIHEALIDEAVFYEVQDLIDTRKKPQRIKQKIDERMPLRNFLVCPKCTRTMTGSRSINKKGIPYAYYHCISKCGSRFNADKVNQSFVDHLGILTVSGNDIERFKHEIVSDFREQLSERNSIKREIKKLTDKIARARDFLCDEVITMPEYIKMKEETEKDIRILEYKMNARPANETVIPEMLERVFRVLVNLQERFENGTIAQKRHIACSIYPRNVVYTGEVYRTQALNSSLLHIITKIRELRGEKERANQNENGLPGWVNPEDLVSNNFILDLTRLASITSC